MMIKCILLTFMGKDAYKVSHKVNYLSQPGKDWSPVLNVNYNEGKIPAAWNLSISGYLST